MSELTQRIKNLLMLHLGTNSSNTGTSTASLSLRDKLARISTALQALAHEQHTNQSSDASVLALTTSNFSQLAALMLKREYQSTRTDTPAGAAHPAAVLFGPAALPTSSAGSVTLPTTQFHPAWLPSAALISLQLLLQQSNAPLASMLTSASPIVDLLVDALARLLLSTSRAVQQHGHASPGILLRGLTYVENLCHSLASTRAGFHGASTAALSNGLRILFSVISVSVLGLLDTEARYCVQLFIVFK